MDLSLQTTNHLLNNLLKLLDLKKSQENSRNPRKKGVQKQKRQKAADPWLACGEFGGGSGWWDSAPSADMWDSLSRGIQCVEVRALLDQSMVAISKKRDIWGLWFSGRRLKRGITEKVTNYGRNSCLLITRQQVISKSVLILIGKNTKDIYVYIYIFINVTVWKGETKNKLIFQPRKFLGFT